MTCTCGEDGRRAGRDLDLVGEQSGHLGGVGAARRPVGLVVQPQLDRLAGVGRQVERRRRVGGLVAVDAVALGRLGDVAGDRLEAGPVVDLDVGVVARVRAAVLDVPARLEAQLRPRAGGQGDGAGQRRLVVVALAGPPLLRAGGRSAELRRDRLVGQHDDEPLRLGAAAVPVLDLRPALEHLPQRGLAQLAALGLGGVRPVVDDRSLRRCRRSLRRPGDGSATQASSAFPHFQVSEATLRTARCRSPAAGSAPSRDRRTRAAARRGRARCRARP
jgi:hypothetical protein